MAEQWVGRIIDGRYAVEALIGAGGMGVVLRARHKFTGAHVAVKMLRADLQIDKQLEARFLREAQAPNAIAHNAIVKVHDAGRTPSGELYLVMELLVGQSMRLALRGGFGGPTIRRVSLELLDALAAAHARGFVHRDLKPENVFLADPNATVKLLDFGIAKAAAVDLTSIPGTAAGVVLGTLAYMAPEQLADAAGVDPRADLWAMGVMVYEMLAGRLPYNATTVEQMFVKLAKEQPDPIRAWLPNVAPSIEAFFARALARDPRARYASASEMAGAVAQLPLVSEPPPPVASPSGGMATVATGYSTPGTGFAQSHGPQRAPAMSPSAIQPAVITPVAGTPRVQLPSAMQPAPMTPVGGLPQLQQPMTRVGGSPQLGHPMTGPMQPVPAPMDRGRLLGFALAGVAAIIIVIAIVIATRGGSDRPKHNRTDLVVDNDQPVDAAPHVEAPPADAMLQAKAPDVKQKPDVKPPKQPDATVSHDARPADAKQAPPDAKYAEAKPPPEAKQPETKQEPVNPYPDKPALDCDAACTFLGRCGLRAPDCVAKCKTDAYEGCLPQTSCAAFAKCYINSSDGCSGTISGKGAAKCGDVWSCQAQQCRPDDKLCGCRCALQIAYAKLPALLAADGCVDMNKYKSRNEITALCATQINNCIRQ